MEINRDIYKTFNGSFESRIEDFKKALQDHSKTVNVPAPMEHELIEYIVRNNVKWTVSNDLPITNNPNHNTYIPVEFIRIVLSEQGLLTKIDKLMAKHKHVRFKMWYEKAAFWNPKHSYVAAVAAELELNDEQWYEILHSAMELSE